MPDPQGRVTLWGIESFIAVGEEGAISAAARRLGVSPSAISQQLTGLEAALGAILLDRSARPMRLTPAGLRFRIHAQTILNAEAEARADLAVAGLSGLTTLRLGMIEDFDAEVTPALLTALARDLPGCRFLLETGASHRLIDQLEARALDVIVAADQGSEGTIEGWREVHPILSEPFVAVAPRGFQIPAPETGGANGRDQSISSLPLIQYTARHLMGRQIAAHLAQQNLRPAHRFELDSYHAILAMVAQGEGWTILTPLALHHAARFRNAVTVTPFPFAPLDRSLSLSAREGVLRDIPGQIATRLRGLVDEQVMQPALAAWPWMKGSLRLL